MKTKKQYICPELLVVNVKAQLLTNVSIQDTKQRRIDWEEEYEEQQEDYDAGYGW